MPIALARKSCTVHLLDRAVTVHEDTEGNLMYDILRPVTTEEITRGSVIQTKGEMKEDGTVLMRFGFQATTKQAIDAARKRLKSMAYGQTDSMRLDPLQLSDGQPAIPLLIKVAEGA